MPNALRMHSGRTQDGEVAIDQHVALEEACVRGRVGGLAEDSDVIGNCCKIVSNFKASLHLSAAVVSGSRVPKLWQ
jgi:hypothetical protein